MYQPSWLFHLVNDINNDDDEHNNHNNNNDNNNMDTVTGQAGVLVYHWEMDTPTNLVTPKSPLQQRGSLDTIEAWLSTHLEGYSE